MHCIATIGEGVPQLQVTRVDGLKHRRRVIVILNIVGIDNQPDPIAGPKSQKLFVSFFKREALASSYQIEWPASS